MKEVLLSEAPSSLTYQLMQTPMPIKMPPLTSPAPKASEGEERSV